MYAPVPLWTEGALREVLFLLVLGLMVSLLGLSRTLPPPSPRLVPERSALRADCGIELTVSVSTVMLRVPSVVLDFADDSGDRAALVRAFLCRGAVAEFSLLGLALPSLLFPSLSPLSPLRDGFPDVSSPEL